VQKVRSRRTSATCRIALAVVAALLVSGGARADETASDVAAPPVIDADPSAATKHELTAVPSIWATLRAQFEPQAGRSEPVVGDVPSVYSSPIRLTLREAVASALQSNPGLIGQSLEPLAQQQAILAAQAQFDPILGGEANLNRLVQPSGTVLAGAQVTTQVNGNWNFFLSKQLVTGAQFRIDWLNNRFNTDSAFQGLAPQYQPQALISLNQPLLRGFGLYFTRLQIWIAENATDSAVATYRANAANFIRQVVQSYWRLVAAEEGLKVLESSLDLARQTVHDNRIRVDVGVLPPVSVKESEAEAARREEEVIVGTNLRDQARRNLRQIVYFDGGSGAFPRPVEPVDQPMVDKVHTDYESALQTAMTNRPEIEVARLTVRGSELTVDYNKNQLLPRVDLVGGYGINGLSGSAAQRTDPINGGTVVNAFGGTYGDGLGRMFSGDYYSYKGGIRIEVPIANAGAEAQYTQSRVQQQQAQSNYRQEVSNVALEIGQAVGDVLSNLQRISASRVARELSEENLRNQTKRYDVGMVTTTDLLIFQDQVARARLTEIQAIVDYNNSIADLERAQGTILQRFNVEIAPRAETETPIWARF
jgi:outer membrane protein